MPRYLNYDDVLDGHIEGTLYYSNAGDAGQIRMSQAGDHGANGQFLPINTVLVSRFMDESSPWLTIQEWTDLFGYDPSEWNNYDEEDELCDCYECRSDRGETRDEDTHDPYGQTTADDPEARPSPLLIPDLPNERQTRLTSVEIEVGMGGSYLAEEFYKLGLSDNGYMLEYHSGDDDQFVRVEEDASVAAEIIFSKMDLSDPTHASQFEQGIKVIRDAIKEDRCKLDMRCGLHVHVGLNRTSTIPGYSRSNLTSLYHLWNYLEDTIFRLAAANWKGHRSEHGNMYSPKTRKGLDSAEMLYSRNALNLGNFMNSVSNVIARSDDAWENYDLYGCPTVEFRVFNTSANARKIRAYVALCQALVAFAQTVLVTPDACPPLEWMENTEPDAAASAERLAFILNELPLTDEERDDIRYCAEKCSLSEIYATL